MGYQEGYLMTRNDSDFEKIKERIQNLGEDFYEWIFTKPVCVIEFTKNHGDIKKGQKAFYFVGDRGYFAQKSVFGLDHDTDKYREFIQSLEDKCGIIATEEVNPKGIWEDSTPEGYEYCVIKHEFVFDKSKVKEELFEKEKEYHESESELLTGYGICLNSDQQQNDRANEHLQQRYLRPVTTYVGTSSSL